MIDKVVILHEYGAPKHFIGLKYLQQEGFIKEIDFVEFNIRSQIKSSILSLNYKKFSKLLYNIKELIVLLRKRDQIIIIGAAPFDSIIPYIRMLNKKNKIIYYTSWPFWDGIKWVKKPIINKQKDYWYKFIENSVSVGVTEKTCNELELKGAHSFHIPHAVDTTVFKPMMKNSNKTIVLFIGTFIPRKGILVLLEAIKTTEWPNNTEFWFAGDGPLERQINEASERFPIKNIGYVGNEQQLSSIYRKADIFVLPSIDFVYNDIENFGIVLIEAMASGLPVVTTDCIGPKEIVNDNLEGFVVPQGNVKMLQQRILYLINNPEIREKMGKKGLEKVNQLYEIKIIAEKWKNVLKYRQHAENSTA